MKGLGAYHPQAIGYDWSLRPILYADLCKAKREAEYPEVRRPAREVWIEPTIDDLNRFADLHLAPAPGFAVDIETVGDMITCIGFAPDPAHALVIPFFDPLKPGKNYWKLEVDERIVWTILTHWLESDRWWKVFHNGMFDINVLWRTRGIAVRRAEHDSMLLHHALQPEMRKSLAFVGSIYTDESAWKLIRRPSAKREE